MKKSKYNAVVKLLETAFYANVNAHCIYNRNKEQKVFYKEKQRCVDKAIILIKKYALPIKHGVKECIYYFEESSGRQVSFHVNYSWKRHNYHTNKQFNGEWIGTVNQHFPLSFK